MMRMMVVMIFVVGEPVMVPVIRGPLMVVVTCQSARLGE